MNGSEYYILDVLENDDRNSNENRVDNYPKKKFVLLIEKEIDSYNNDGRLVSSGISFTISALLKFDSFGVHKCGSSSYKWNASINFDEKTFSISCDRHGFGGDIRIDKITGLQGHRVGTYILHEIVDWLKSFNLANEHEFEMHPIDLTINDAQGVNGIRRKKLYTDAGIILMVEDNGSGHSTRDNTLQNLKLNKSWQKIL